MTTVVPTLLARWAVRSTLLVLLVSALTFVLVSLTPGDPARTILGQSATQEQYEALRLQMGLDEPLLTRYGAWLADALHGDLGASLFSGEAVTSLIGQRLGVTLTLIAGGVLAAGLLGVALGVVSARSSGVLARVVDVASLVGSAIPPFWLGLVLSAVFAVGLRLVPVVGYTSPATDPVAWFLSILLPVTTLALAGTAIVAKQTRDAMRDELGKDYVLVLRSHGAGEWTVQIKHALRNAGVPVVTVLGVLLIGLLGGTVLVESVFSLPGLGGLAVTSTLRHDLPVIQGVTVLFAVVVVAVNLLVDLVNAWINPKVSA